MSSSSRGRSHIGESGVSKSDGGGSSGEDEDDDWDSLSAESGSTSASLRASISLSSVQHEVVASGSACGTMGSEGGGERGRSWIDGCDVRGLSGSGVNGVGVQGRVRGPVWGQGDVPAACAGVSSDKRGSGTVCFGSESVGGGDG